MAVTLNERLGNLLIQNKMINPAQLEEALKMQIQSKERIGDVLVRLGYITRDNLISVLSVQLGVTPIHLARFKVQPDAVAAIPKKIAEHYCLLPVSKFEQILTVAMADPLNVHAIDDLRRMTGFEVRPLLASEKEIKDAIDQYYSENTAAALETTIKDLESQDDSSVELMKDSAQEGNAQELMRLTQEEPVVKLTNSILAEAIKRRSSDIFIEPEDKRLRVRFRVDGLLQEGVSTGRAMHSGVVSRIKVMSNLDIAEHRMPQDGRFKIKYQGKDVDFRVSVLPTYFGEKVVLRILDQNQAVLNVDKLGFESQPLDALKKAATHPHGMILVCGPTGSGKSTTLYSVLKLIDNIDINIVTVEDPVEFQIEGINQVAIRTEVNLTFAKALRSILRQDPDVIMVGEIRDGETADVAVKAALTGHLVLSTLHTTTAAGSIIRLVNMGIEPFLISSSLLLAGAQRLARRICETCREPYEPSKELLNQVGVLERHLKGKKPVFYRGKGCEKCHGKGYSGRVVLLEAMPITPKIKEMILKKAQEYELKEMGRKEGMMTLRENGIAKILTGITTPEEVFRVTIGDQEIPI